MLGQPQKALPHARVEGVALPLHPVGSLGAGALMGQVLVQVEQQGPVGHDVATGQSIGVAHGLLAELAAESLVGQGGVAEPVAHHHGPLVERRYDDLLHELGARRLKKQQLGHGRDVQGGLVQQDLPHRLPQGRRAGLAQAHDLAPGALQGLYQHGHLRGFSHAVKPLKAYEEAGVPLRGRCRGGVCHAWPSSVETSSYR